MLSDEERKAIDWFREDLAEEKENCGKYNDYKKQVIRRNERLLNLIEKQSKEIEEAEQKEKKAYIDGTNVAHNLCNKKWVEIIQAQIQELENERKDLVYAQPFVDGQIGVLKRVLKRGEE